MEVGRSKGTSLVSPEYWLGLETVGTLRWVPAEWVEHRRVYIVTLNRSGGDQWEGSLASSVQSAVM